MLKKRKFVLIKGVAGLGDRLLALSGAINYAKLTQRLTVIDWSDGIFFEPGICHFFEYFELKNVEYLKLNNNTFGKQSSFYPPTFKENPQLSLDDSYIMKHPKYVSKIPIRMIPKGVFRKIYGYWVYSENEILKFNFFRKGNFEQGRNLSIKNNKDVVIFGDMGTPLNKKTFLNHVSLSATMKEKVNKHFSDLSLGENSIGIHVRLTDKEPLKSIDILIRKIKLYSRDYKIFLATDNSDVEKLFYNSFKNICKLDKYLPKVSIGGVHHKAKLDKNWSNAEKVLEESILDMWILSKCTYLYYLGNSSFSRISACLHTDTSKQFDWNLL